MAKSPRIKQPSLPDCVPMEMKFKDVPCVNGTGQPLALCKKCDGAGSVCTGQKKDPKVAPTPPHTVYIACSGNDRIKYQRHGYTLTCERCTACGGAGLVVEGN